MKKIYIVLSTGEEKLVGLALTLHLYLLAVKKQRIVPLNGDINYTLVHNIYNKKRDQYVTYKAVKA